MQILIKRMLKKRLFLATASIALFALYACGSKPKENIPLQPPRADLMKVPDELTKSATVAVNQGYVDVVNDLVTDQQHVFHAKRDAPLWVRGWAYDENDKKVPERVWLELTGKTSGLRLFIPGKRVNRADVVAGFKVPWAIMCGFETPVERDHNIPPGAYDIKLYQIDDQTTAVTKYYSTPAMTLVIE